MGSLVKHPVHFPKKVSTICLDQIRFLELEASLSLQGGKVFFLASSGVEVREGVYTAHGVALGRQGLADVGADEAGGPCHKAAHPSVILVHQRLGEVARDHRSKATFATSSTVIEVRQRVP
jgi:hypothetical protein